MIGQNIYRIRRKKGFSLTELSERANISKSYISNIERNINKNPSIQVLTKIANVLEVGLESLLDMKASIECPQQIESEWIEFINDLKDSGIQKGQIQEYRPLIEFIKWKNENVDSNKNE